MQRDLSLIGSLITDDEALALIKPANADAIGEEVAQDQAVPEGARLEYPQAIDLATDWSQRVEVLKRSWERACSTDNEAKLWAAEVDRQQLLVHLANGLSGNNATHCASAHMLLYGVPSTDMYGAAVDEVWRYAGKMLKHDDKRVTVLASDLTNFLPDRPPFTPAELPSVETVGCFKDWADAAIIDSCRVAVGTLGLGRTDKANAMQIADAANLVIWPWGAEAVITDEVSSVTFEASKKRLAIPPSRKATPGILTKMLAHESVHIARWANGLKGSLALGAYGLPGYLPFEEGVAVAVADMVALKEGATISGYGEPEAYLTIGLAHGLAGDRWSMDRVYQLMLRHYALEDAVKQAKTGEVDTSAAYRAASVQAWKRVVRTYRGQLCPRDISYRDGAAAAWRWIGENPDGYGLLLAGKADLTKATHREYVSSYVV